LKPWYGNIVDWMDGWVAFVSTCSVLSPSDLSTSEINVIFEAARWLVVLTVNNHGELVPGKREVRIVRLEQSTDGMS